ncbi:MAG: sodium:proton antiporter [Cyclobacteriaceae bacterium]|nr:MAG: sodium:proton antiporter [Cyclobacteriaceae bacterium]
MLGTNVYLFGSASLDGSNQIALLLSAAVAGVIAIRLGVGWRPVLNSIVNSISSAMSSIIILLLIGSLAGTWLISGVVPAMIYYGLQILNPTIFLVAACVVCAVVSLATGSSWSTVATVGIALLGIGQTLGMQEGVVGGAIISGAYFGDKMSPLSDTTNLAPAMAGTDLFTHIKYMAITTVPSIIISLIIYLAIGFFSEAKGSVNDVEAVLLAIDSRFNVTGWLFLVPAVVIVMIIKRVPALPALLVGVLTGGLFAVIFQPELVVQVSGIEGNFIKSVYVGVMQSMYGTVEIITDHAMVNDLLSSGGMSGMMNTVWLILCAMTFGGAMEAGGLLKVIASEVIKLAKGTGSLIASTVLTCGFFNITASDQYMAIVVPGRMYADTYRSRGLKPENLSRTLEDSGTVTSVLVPWNTCGATQASVLGVATLVYAPFSFFNIISPFMTMLVGFLGYKIRYYEPDEEPDELQEEVLVK